MRQEKHHNTRRVCLCRVVRLAETTPDKGVPEAAMGHGATLAKEDRLGSAQAPPRPASRHLDPKKLGEVECAHHPFGRDILLEVKRAGD